MLATVLIENSTPSDRCTAKHGLSLFLETVNHRILFDMGPDGCFLDNASALGIDVSQADLAIISHGHFDHGGGLSAYLNATEDCDNPAPIYIRASAFNKHYAKTPVGMHDIGIDLALADNPRFIKTESQLRIDDELLLFSDVAALELTARSNDVLMEQHEHGYAVDSFPHEQNLLVKEDDKTILVSGCSHCGIVNIIKQAESIIGGSLYAVVGGFHLMDPGSGTIEDPETTKAVAAFLASRPTSYYTLHCTGIDAYSILRDHLGDRIRYLYTGSHVQI